MTFCIYQTVQERKRSREGAKPRSGWAPESLSTAPINNLIQNLKLRRLLSNGRCIQANSTQAGGFAGGDSRTDRSSLGTAAPRAAPAGLRAGPQKTPVAHSDFPADGCDGGDHCLFQNEAGLPSNGARGSRPGIAEYA